MVGVILGTHRHQREVEVTREMIPEGALKEVATGEKTVKDRGCFRPADEGSTSPKTEQAAWNVGVGVRLNG